MIPRRLAKLRTMVHVRHAHDHEDERTVFGVYSAKPARSQLSDLRPWIRIFGRPAMARCPPTCALHFLQDLALLGVELFLRQHTLVQELLEVTQFVHRIIDPISITLHLLVGRSALHGGDLVHHHEHRWRGWFIASPLKLVAQEVHEIEFGLGLSNELGSSVVYVQGAVGTTEEIWNLCFCWAPLTAVWNSALGVPN